MMMSLRRAIGMRNKQKFLQNVLLNGLLVLSLVISVVLTAFIFSSFGKNEAPDQSTAQQPEKQLLEIFRPTQYIVNQTDGSQQLVMNATDAKLKKMRHALTDAQLTDAQTKTVNIAGIKKVLATKKAQIFHYSDVVPISYFNIRYDQRVSTRKNLNFDYFVLALDRSNNGYFVNTKTNQITTVKVNKLNHHDAWQLAQQLPKSLNINFQNYHNRVGLNYLQKIRLPVYSYLVNNRDPKTYVSALLGTINQLNVTQDGDKTVYSNKLNNQTIVYDPNWATVTFEDHNKKNKLPEFYVDRLNTGLSQINLLQSDFTDTRFYESQQNGQKITFRTYVEGFPVYFQSEIGAIHMTMDKHGNLTSTYSLNEIGVPVPNNQPDVILPSTREIIKQLSDAGVQEKDYNFIAPGYQWLLDQGSQAAVNMEPTWMIETASGWQSVSSFLKTR